MAVPLSSAMRISYDPSTDPLVIPSSAPNSSWFSGALDGFRDRLSSGVDTAFSFFQDVGQRVGDAVLDAGDWVNEHYPPARFVKETGEKIAGLLDNDDSGSVAASGSFSPSPQIDYLNADLAKAYGMDATTAYQEALSNTSYQRAVKDLQAAGLNPVLAASGLDGASGVYSARKNGDGVSVSGSGSSAHEAYKYLKNIGTLIGAVAGAAITKSPAGAASGAMVGGQIAGSIGNLVD